MGSRLSIDKHVSQLQDILELNPKLLEKVKFENNIPDCITQHLKIWKFYEQPSNKINNEPVNLSLIQTSGFNFMSNECYLVLLIYRKAHEEYNKFLSFPHQMWGVVESYSNLTPRGLEFPLATSEKELFDSFRLPQRSKGNDFEYMIFVWNGKAANPLVKAQALSNAFELENLLDKGSDSLLKILFSGGVVGNKKLSKGSIIQLSSEADNEENDNFNEMPPQQEQQVRETVYLFNFLFPTPKKREYSKLSDFLKKKQDNNDYENNFVKVENKYEQKQQQQNVSVSGGKVPSLNFNNLKQNKNENENISKVKIPKIDLSLKNIGQNDSNPKSLDIGLSLVEGVEYNEESKPQQGMKLSLLNLKQRGETTYQDIANEDNQGFNFDIRDTDRKKLKIQYFADICSEVIENLLFVGGEQIAYNYEILKEMGVTHVVNCAGDVCINKYPQDFHYTTYYLKDSKVENIECLFYEIITLIDQVKSNNGKVLIHCVQGVSRSVTLCIAYLIFKNHLTYSNAFDIIKSKRGVASPNMGFTVQLLLFQKRLQGTFDTIPVAPRVFAVGRGVSANNNLVCRMLMEQLYSGKLMKTLDSRGTFLVQSEGTIYIWIGPQCLGDFQKRSLDYALQYTNYLKVYEKAQNEPIIVQAEEEPQDFRELWGVQDQLVYKQIKEWDDWYQQIDIEQFLKEKEQQQKQYSKDVEENKPSEQQLQSERRNNQRPLLYIFPNKDQPLAVFDLEDLDTQSLCLLFKETEYLQVFVWRGNLCEAEDDDEKNYVDDIINENYGHYNHEDIFIYKEEPNDESEEFLDNFQ